MCLLKCSPKQCLPIMKTCWKLWRAAWQQSGPCHSYLTLFSTSKNGSHPMQMNFTLILSQSVSKFDMGNCVMFYDVFMKWEGPQQLLKVWFCKLKVLMWILTCMLYVSIVVTYIFTVNEFSITKTNFTFSCKIKRSDISNSLCCRFFSSQFILFLPGSFLTTVGNFS